MTAHCSTTAWCTDQKRGGDREASSAYDHILPAVPSRLEFGVGVGVWVRVRVRCWCSGAGSGWRILYLPRAKNDHRIPIIMREFCRERVDVLAITAFRVVTQFMVLPVRKWPPERNAIGSGPEYITRYGRASILATSTMNSVTTH
jgi:hypothetical protein